VAQRFEVKDFGKKLTLLLRSGKSRFKRTTDLSIALQGITKDYLSRFINGTRPLSENAFTQIVTLTSDVGIGAADWHEPLEMFGQKLGLSTTAIAEISGVATSGIDFRSRNKDEYNLRSVHQLIGGYWESFYYSVSTFGQQRISHDLVVIDAPDAQGLMPCRVLDQSFTYEGYCFPIHTAFLYMMLEKVQVQDEIIVYMVNRPERERDVELDGIILCTSGGVHDKVAVPCAARVAFRFLGSTREHMMDKFPSLREVPVEKFERSLHRLVSGETGYLEPTTIKSSDTRLLALRDLIDNTIFPDQVPFAMRMERSSNGKEQQAMRTFSRTTRTSSGTKRR
jgi:hypothetical protein